MMQVIKDITHMLFDLYCNSVLEQHGVCKKLYELKDHSGRQTCSMTCNILTMYFNINDIYPIVCEAFDFFVKV